MTDDLLDEATRLADATVRTGYLGAGGPSIIRALVARVRTAEEDYHEIVPRFGQAVIERNEARAKLDAARALAEDTSESVNNDWGWGYDAAMERVLAILDRD